MFNGPNAARDALIMDWQTKHNRLQFAKTEELEARNKLVALFPEAKEGTNSLDLGSGYTLKYKMAFNYTLSNAKAPKNANVTPFATDVALEAIEKMGNEGKFIAERLVSWSPSLSLSEYRDLPEEMKKAIDKALTISPATPTFELAVPKG